LRALFYFLFFEILRSLFEISFLSFEFFHQSEQNYKWELEKKRKKGVAKILKQKFPKYNYQLSFDKIQEIKLLI